MDFFQVDSARPDKAYAWLEDRLQFYGEDFRLLPKDCDCYLMQVGPTDMTEGEAVAFYETLDDPEVYGFLEVDWKGFDASTIEYINPWLQSVQIAYESDDDDKVISLEIEDKPEDDDPIEAFGTLQDRVLNHAVPKTITCEEMLHTIRNYVMEVLHNPEYDELANDIRSATTPKKWRVRRYEPGTGQGTEQFYQFAKAIAQNQVRCSTFLTRKDWCVLLEGYAMDERE